MPQKTLWNVSVTMFLPVQRKRSIKAKKPTVNTVKKSVFRRTRNVSENTRKNCEDLSQTSSPAERGKDTAKKNVETRRAKHPYQA